MTRTYVRRIMDRPICAWQDRAKFIALQNAGSAIILKSILRPFTASTIAFRYGGRHGDHSAKKDRL